MSTIPGETSSDSPDVRVFTTSERESSLRAAAAAIAVLVRGSAEINGVPVTELVAKQLGMEDPDRLGAQRKVMDLLAHSTGPLQAAVEAQHQHDITAFQDTLPARASNLTLQDQMH